MAKRGPPVGETVMEMEDAQRSPLPPADDDVEPTLGDIFRYVKRTDTNVSQLKRSIAQVEKTANEARTVTERASTTAELALKEGSF